jgi:hypothetical protein
VQIELIQQHCDRASVYRDVLDHGGAGFHQLCTVTHDYDATKAHYERLGYELVSEIDAVEPRTAYFDTLDDFGFFTEIAEATPEFLGQLAKISETCAEWDGTDPVRLLTRDGYRSPEPPARSRRARRSRARGSVSSPSRAQAILGPLRSVTW